VAFNIAVLLHYRTKWALRFVLVSHLALQSTLNFSNIVVSYIDEILLQSIDRLKKL